MKKLLIFLLLLSLFVISGCAQPEKKDKTVIKEEAVGLLKGVSLSPKSFEKNDFLDFFEKAKQTGKILMWAGDWDELSNTQSGAPAVTSSLADNYKLIPVVEAQFFTQSTGQLLRPLDAATKENYKNSAVAFADTFKPKYIGLGIEVNILYEKSPADFDVFAQFYSEVYDAVKEKSPDTKVFTIFQLEKMKGMNGGLFGGTNDLSKSQWFLIDKFPKSDIIVFTTYPGLVYKNPMDIPADYYTEVQPRVSKPIAFTEIGWHSKAGPKGWESSEAEQAEFVKKFFELTRGMDIELAVWSFIHDPKTIEPFNSMGLLRDDGTARPVWDAWVKA